MFTKIESSFSFHLFEYFFPYPICNYFVSYTFFICPFTLAYRIVYIDNCFPSCYFLHFQWPSIIHVGGTNILKVQLYDQFENPYHLRNSDTESLTVSINNREVSGFFSIDESYANYFTLLQRGETFEGMMDIQVVCRDNFSIQPIEISRSITLDHYYSLK